MLSVIVPTMGTRLAELDRLLKSIFVQNIEVEVIIVVQSNHDSVQKMLNKYKDLDLKVFYVHFKGLSKSRNFAMKYVTGSWVIFSDDDCWYPEKYFHNAIKYIQDKPIVISSIYDPVLNKSYKRYPLKQKEYTMKDIFRISSIEIIINIEKIPKKYIRFDENFGLGAEYPIGEETTLMFDLWKLGFRKIYFNPEIIVFHLKKDIKPSQLDYYSKGAFFARNFPGFSGKILGLLFIVKKNKLSKNNPFSFRNILKGYEDYSKKRIKNNYM
ncbi:glycosyltransferase family 2 protein [Bacillus cereus]|uniref:glycosyltransferase family 2 protein n=1 Tax=Bacillus cereus TaxID=1396 RepID=UPI000C289700|nr:glycosyltransferase family 2 protein [Bacillus cereus]